ncbi:hypothetical protein ACF07V_36325 [Streptomyces sp. NPDC015661]|uniref:DinB/UmuC family translesion DNA polymerase n=1 Tax=Streptomyces sp. NPDC015661 TaxID=3364961 RepID=UPI0036FCDDE4
MHRREVRCRPRPEAAAAGPGGCLVARRQTPRARPDRQNTPWPSPPLSPPTAKGSTSTSPSATPSPPGAPSSPSPSWTSRTLWQPNSSRATTTALPDLVAELGERLRGPGQITRAVTLSVQLADGSTIPRTRKLPEPAAHTEDLRTAAWQSWDGLAFQQPRVAPDRHRRGAHAHRGRPQHTAAPRPPARGTTPVRARALFPLVTYRVAGPGPSTWAHAQGGDCAATRHRLGRAPGRRPLVGKSLAKDSKWAEETDRGCRRVMGRTLKSATSRSWDSPPTLGGSSHRSRLCG